MATKQKSSRPGKAKHRGVTASGKRTMKIAKNIARRYRHALQKLAE